MQDLENKYKIKNAVRNLNQAGHSWAEIDSMFNQIKTELKTEN